MHKANIVYADPVKRGTCTLRLFVLVPFPFGDKQKQSGVYHPSLVLVRKVDTKTRRWTPKRVHSPSEKLGVFGHDDMAAQPFRVSPRTNPLMADFGFVAWTSAIKILACTHINVTSVDGHGDRS